MDNISLKFETLAHKRGSYIEAAKEFLEDNPIYLDFEDILEVLDKNIIIKIRQEFIDKNFIPHLKQDTNIEDFLRG